MWNRIISFPFPGLPFFLLYIAENKKKRYITKIKAKNDILRSDKKIRRHCQTVTPSKVFYKNSDSTHQATEKRL